MNLSFLGKISQVRLVAIVSITLALIIPGLTYIYTENEVFFLSLDFLQLLSISIIYSFPLYILNLFMNLIVYICRDDDDLPKGKDAGFSYYVYSSITTIIGYYLSFGIFKLIPPISSRLAFIWEIYICNILLVIITLLFLSKKFIARVEEESQKNKRRKKKTIK